MKILMFSSYLPYPLYSGGHIRLYNIIKELSKRHEIVLVCEKRSYQTEKDIGEVKKFCKEVITVDRKKQWTMTNILKTGFSSYPFLLIGHTNPLITQFVESKLKDNFDLIHIETFYIMQNLPAVSIPTVLVEHNIEYAVYNRYIKNAPFFLRVFLALDIAKMKYWEEYFWKKATKLVAVSEVEKRQMGRVDVEVVPNGVDVAKFKIQNSKVKINRSEKRILFIGDFRWLQNRDAVEWILKEIWPVFVKTSAGKPETKLWIVGKNIPEGLKQLTSDPNVIFDENAPEDTAEIFRYADILLAPIRAGGGTSYKILEAMASGVPVVTTPLGIEGLDVDDKKEVLVGESAEELAERAIDVLQDEELREKLTKNARKPIEEKYDWKIIVRKLEAVYESAVSKNPGM